VNNGTKIGNKRAFYLAQDYIPDGITVSRKGLVLTGTGHGLDVLDDMDRVMFRVRTNHSVADVQFTGPDLNTVWLLGNKGMSRVT